MNYKLSIITVNLNDLDGLKATFNSVKCQTNQEFEYIVIDGLSNDGSLELIKENDKTLIHFWVSEPDSGIYQAMNKGISMATGEYLLFLNSGDRLYNETIVERILPKLSSDIVYGNAWFKKGNKEWLEIYPSKLSFFFFYQYTLNHQSTFIKSCLFQKYGLYREDIKINADWEFFLRVLFVYKVSYSYVNEIVAFFEHNGLSSLPQSIPLIKQERERVLQCEYPYYNADYKFFTDRTSRKYLRVRDNRYTTLILKFVLSILQLFLKKTKKIEI